MVGRACEGRRRIRRLRLMVELMLVLGWCVQMVCSGTDTTELVVKVRFLLLVEHEQLDLLEEVSERFLVLLALHLQRLYVLRQRGHLALQLAHLLIFRQAGLAAERRLHHMHLAIKNAAPRTAYSDQLALLRKLAPSERAPDPSLDGPDRPPQMLESL